MICQRCSHCGQRMVKSMWMPGSMFCINGCGRIMREKPDDQAVRCRTGEGESKVHQDDSGKKLDRVFVRDDRLAWREAMGSLFPDLECD